MLARSASRPVRRLAQGDTAKRLTVAATQLPTVPLWIDNEAVAGSSVTLTRAGKPRCQLVTASAQVVDQAVESSKKAFGHWRKTTAYDRQRVLSNVARLLPERFDSLTQALAADASFTPALLGADRATAINVTTGAAALSISVDGWVPPTVDNSLAMVLREPYGPTLSIPAFNYPLTLALRSIVYPLACGNTVIMKSSIHVPQAHHLLGGIFAEAGLPSGALQILNFAEDNAAPRISQLIAHDDVKYVNFTGSTRLGRNLAAQCGQHLNLMELGGKSAAIVLPSADVRVAANNILFASFLNSGQICMSTERAIVHADVYDAFVEAVCAALPAVRAGGPPFELIRPGAPSELQGLVDDAVSRGATLLTPAPAYTLTGAAPVVLADVAATASLAQLESFAPLVLIQRAKSTEHAVALANAHETGLTSAVYGDVGAALAVARELEAGAVHINSMTVHDEHGLPHGGWKTSGWGRFNGRGAVESFTQTKNITIGNGAPLPLAVL